MRVNLHTHTCLSPCADLDMYPAAIVHECLRQGLDVIAITDHNASENVEYVQRVAADMPLVVLPGMEVCTREEAHVLAVFDELDALEKLQTFVYANLEGKNNEDVFGIQAIVNELDEVEGFNDRLLIGATSIALKSLVDKIHSLCGLAIAAHIDRGSFSVISQLGFVSPDAGFDALEISSRMTIPQARQRYPELSGYPFIQSSDAHYIRDLSSAHTMMSLDSGSLAEIRMALNHTQGRCILDPYHA